TVFLVYIFFFSSRRRHTRFSRDWSSDVCSSDLGLLIKEVFLGVNFIVYNIYYLLYFSFFFYVFMKTIEEKKFQRYIKIGAWLFQIGRASCRERVRISEFSARSMEKNGATVRVSQ